MDDRRYVPAAHFHVLTPLYEPLVGLFASGIWRVVADEAAARTPDRGHVIDLGCGPGTVLRGLARSRGDLRLTGVDIDDAILLEARRKATGLPIDFVQASAERTGLADRSGDCVMSTLVFHHLSGETKRAAFREAHRLLGPGGTFLLGDFSLPSGVRPPRLFSWLAWFEPEVGPQWEGELFDLAAEVGRTIETLRIFGRLISLYAVTFGDDHALQ